MTATPATSLTSGTGDAAPGGTVGIGVADTIQADQRPVGRSAAPGVEQERAPAAVRHEQFRTVDPQAARRFFAGAYTPGWRIAGMSVRLAVSHRRWETMWVTVDEVSIQGRAAFEVPTGHSVMVIQPRAGTLTVSGGRLPVADCPILLGHGTSYALQVNGARFDVVRVAADALQRVSPEGLAPLARQAQFRGWGPCSRAAVRAWHRALDYVTATLASPDTAQQPLVVAAMGPVLAGALLECYPPDVTEQEAAAEPAFPEALKDAVTFIRHHAGAEVGINDVAAAVHLTPRAVQYLFRRQLDTTPTEYIRRVRLTRAHQDLMAGTPSTATVAEIALRWGFAHTGRFAVLYRQTYGQSPHTTLRQ